MPLISVTRLRIRSWRYFLPFVLDARRSIKQAAAAPGSLAVCTLRDRANTFWTMTAWSSEAEMKAFMTSGAHGAAMRKLLDWCDEAALVHWMQDAADLPTWAEAHKRMQQGGRSSKVHHPSTNQTAFTIPAPVTGRTREQRAK